MPKKENNKLLQLRENEEVESMIDFFNEYFRESSFGHSARLRTCQAKVYTSDRFYVLQSYNTIVAFIDRENDTLYDILRYAYGYTPTSAQHISKFSHDYGAGKWGCTSRLTWREVS